VNKAELLDAAKAAVADRGLDYGSPEDNFGRIADLWEVHLRNRKHQSARLTAADVAQMMVLIKIARLQNTPNHLDSWTDIAGYAACGADIFDRPTEEPVIERSPYSLWRNGGKNNFDWSDNALDRLSEM
jgi:hypothetical protein